MGVLVQQLLLPDDLRAQVVRFSGDVAGQGVPVFERGQCVILTARHVVDVGSARLALQSAGSRTTYDASVGSVRDSFALVRVSGTPPTGCFGALRWRAPAQTDRGRSADLVDIDDVGILRVTPVRIESIDPYSVRFLETADAQVQPGMSGAPLLVDGVVIGLLEGRVELGSGTIGYAHRIDFGLGVLQTELVALAASSTDASGSSALAVSRSVFGDPATFWGVVTANVVDSVGAWDATAMSRFDIGAELQPVIRAFFEASTVRHPISRVDLHQPLTPFRSRSTLPFRGALDDGCYGATRAAQRTEGRQPAARAIVCLATNSFSIQAARTAYLSALRLSVPPWWQRVIDDDSGTQPYLIDYRVCEGVEASTMWPTGGRLARRVILYQGDELVLTPNDARPGLVFAVLAEVVERCDG